MRKHIKCLHVLIFFLLITLVFNIALPVFTHAKDNDKNVIRVGWHEPPFFIKDQQGRESGYSYEYQLKVAAYTDWEYEYVEGTFSELLQMLKDGDIDLLGNISYSEERAKEMLFSSIPMGTDSYYLFISHDNNEITPEDILSLNGKRIGVAKGSIQKDIFISWINKLGINAEIIELTSPEEDSIKLLGSEIDAFVTLDVYGSLDSIVPVYKIGSSDYYFAVNKDRPDILSELDAALNKIQDENRYFEKQLYDKYLKISETNRYLNSSEKDWLKNHSTIKVGYQDNYLAFCAQDPSSGKLTGALKDYLDVAANSFENIHLKFETKCYPTTSAAIDALKNGEIDCLFPANLSSYDAELLDLVMTPAIMCTGMDAVVRASEKKSFLKKNHITVAVNEGNTNYSLFLAEHYPDWEVKYYKDTLTALDAIANNEADCIIISSYRYSNISKQCEKLHLTTLYTGVDMDYYFAVNKGDTQLYSILAKITGIVPEATVTKSLIFYSTEDVKISLIDLIKDNLFIVTAALSIVLLIILLLVLFSIRAEKKVIEGKHLVKDLNKRVYVDALTSVRNKGAFNDYLKKLQTSIDNDEKPEFAIGIFDCNDLKSINDKYGHDKGDIYLKSACGLICKIFNHSPVFRIGGDEFAVILINTDYEDRETLFEKFEKSEEEICSSVQHSWEEVRVAYGFKIYDPSEDFSVLDIVKCADSIMYENKKELKSINL